jgi:hypothetical protein
MAQVYLRPKPSSANAQGAKAATTYHPQQDSNPSIPEKHFSHGGPFSLQRPKVVCDPFCVGPCKPFDSNRKVQPFAEIKIGCSVPWMHQLQQLLFPVVESL